jgi:hypothetical protein
MIEEKDARNLVLRNNAAAAARERHRCRETCSYPKMFQLASNIIRMEKKKLISQMSTIEYRNKHQRVQRIRHPGAGAWFAATSEFKEWLDCSSSLDFFLL